MMSVIRCGVSRHRRRPQLHQRLAGADSWYRLSAHCNCRCICSPVTPYEYRVAPIYAHAHGTAHCGLILPDCEPRSYDRLAKETKHTTSLLQMRRIMNRNFFPVTLAAALLMSASAFAADKFPEKPIRMVVPFPPGAASDFLARTVGQKLSEQYGEQVVTDNRPGAGGLVGSGIVATAIPNGYTIALVGQPHLVNPLIHKDAGYRPFADFSSVIEVASMANALVVAPGVQAKSVSELIGQAKEQPGKFNFGSLGVGSSSHLAGEMFKSAAGIDIVHVPFRLLGDVYAE